MASLFIKHLILLFFIIFANAKDSAKIDYHDALSKSLVFFQGKRSGKLPHDRTINLRADSGLKDGFVENIGIFLICNCRLKRKKISKNNLLLVLEDLTGGYYDAGDDVKFGLPMEFTTTMLSWRILEFGGPVSDHKCCERAEDMTNPRSVYKVTPQNLGSDVAGETAAALAATSMVFKRVDPKYSAKLPETAKKGLYIYRCL